MKKIIPLFILFSLQSRSQSLVLTQAAFEPAIGDSSKYYVLDSSYFASGLGLANTGADFVWNFGPLGTTSTQVVSGIVSPSTIPASTNFPGCTYVQSQGALKSFYKSVSSPTQQTEFLGMNSSSLNLNFSNTAIQMRYPFAYGNTVVDGFGGNFTFSLSGTASGIGTVTADGTGTLMLPSSTFTNVLRLKTRSNTDFNAGFVTGNMKQTIYQWYDASQKFPVLTINYQELSLSISPTPTITAQLLGNKNVFVVGMKEEKLGKHLNLYPNPASDKIHVDLEAALKNVEVRLFNMNGEEVWHGTNGDIDISALSPGVYMAECRTGNGIARKKMIKQ